MTSNLPLTPEDEESGPLPFAGASGRGVRVAVIDSGVHVRHPHIGPIAGGLSVTAAGDLDPADYADLLGHGTAVMAAIQEKSPESEYFAVRVFHRELRTRVANLLRALEWCIDQKMDVVNLSLGTTNAVHESAFAHVVSRAAEAGTILVAARDAGGQPCYPGCLPAAFGVGLDWNCPRNRFRYSESEGVFYASGYPRPAPGVPRSRNLQGISFAVANMSAFIARACETRLPETYRTRRIREALALEYAPIPIGE